jgi:enoyl-CoA hydratase
MSYKTILVERGEGIVIISLTQPLLNSQMGVELEDICQEISRDTGDRVIILSSEGDFCLGGEEGGVKGIEAIAHLEIPTMAAISGRALGLGLALCLSCDIRVASPSALFGIPELPSPLGGISQRLPRIIGQGKALELLLGGDIIGAEEAYRIGLVNRIADNPLIWAKDWARKLTGKAPIALKLAKEAVHKGLDMTLDQGLRLEADLYFLLHTTQDRIEGIRAFLEKREAKFKGE